MKKAFQKGDRVSVAWYDGVFKGTVDSVHPGPPVVYGGSAKPGSIQINLDNGTFKWAHPRQCRRIVKKAMRRVWIPAQALAKGFTEFDTRCVTRKPEVGTWDAWVEFIEVRKKP